MLVYYTDTHQRHASTYTAPNNWTAPPGWFSSRGRLFHAQTGALTCEGVNVYNTTNTPHNSYVNASSCVGNAIGQWYSWGVSGGLIDTNGSGYSWQYTFKTAAKYS